MLEISNLIVTNKDIFQTKLNKQIDFDKLYNITFKISEDSILGIYCKTPSIRSNILKTLAGMNIQTNITNSYGKIFDNKKYFKDRIFLDFSNQYISTLNSKEIESNIKTKFNIQFDEVKFKRYMKEYKIHEKVTIDKIYNFTPEATTLSNFAFLNSLKYKYCIVDNPVKNITSVDYIHMMQKEYKQNFNMSIFGIDEINEFANFFDYIIILDDFNKTRYFTPSDSIVVADYNEIESLKPHMMFISKDSSRIIYTNDLNNEDLKMLKKNKINYYIDNILSLEVYL